MTGPRTSLIDSQNILFFLTSLFCLLPFLGELSVFQVSEAREGVVVYEIIRTGELILPLRHGEIIPSKPILFHWFSAAFSIISGEYNEFFLRLPSALAGLGSLLVVYSFAQIFLPRKTALIAPLSLLSSYGFFRLASDGRVDMLFCFLLTFSLYLWFVGFLKSGEVAGIKNRTYFFSGSVLGLAVLTKGPLAIILYALTMFVFVLSEEGIKKLIHLLNPYLLFSLLIPFLWYYLGYLSGGNDFIGRLVFSENIKRLTGAAEITAKPWYYYFSHFWSQTAPWGAVFVILICIFILRKDLPRLIPAEKLDRKVLRFSLSWIVSMFFFYSLAFGKRRAYLLSLLPALSILYSLYLPKLVDSLKFSKKVSVSLKSIYAFLLMTVIALGIAFLTNPGFLSSVPNSSPGYDLFAKVFSKTVSEIPIIFKLYFVILSTLSLVFYYLFIKNSIPKNLLLSCFFLVELTFLVYFNLGLIVKGQTHSYEDFAKKVSKQVGEKDLKFIKQQRDESYDSFFFYYPKRISLVALEIKNLPSGYYISKKSWLNSRKDLETKKILTGGRLKDGKENHLVLFRVLRGGMNAGGSQRHVLLAHSSG